VALFSGIQGAVVDARYACLVAGDMVEHSFDYMRLHSQLSHAGRYGPAEIMQTPGCYHVASFGEPSIKSGLGLAPALEWALPLAKHEGAVRPAYRSLKDGESRRGEGDLVRATVFWSARRGIRHMIWHTADCDRALHGLMSSWRCSGRFRWQHSTFP